MASSTTEQPPTTDGRVDGCGPESVTKPEDRSASRQVAHCAPGAPAPQPLSQPAKLKIRTGPPGEFNAAIILAEKMGEFAKENLTLEYIDMPAADAPGQLAAGNIDALSGGPTAAIMNALNSGIEMKWVVGNYSPAYGGDLSRNQAGIWMRRDASSTPAKPDICDLTKSSLANSLGSGTTAVYWMGTAFEDAGCSLKDVKFEQIPPADQFTALEQSAVGGAYMLDPFWQLAADASDKYALVAVQPNEPNGGFWFSSALIENKPEVAAAFVRAYIRTINTYLQPGYKKNQDVVATLATAIGTKPELLASGDELRFDWEIRAGLTDDVQRWFTELETQKGAVMSEDAIVDRSFYLSAVGADGAGGG